MKKSKKTLTLKKLVISKLTDPTSIMGGSVLTCTPKTEDGGTLCPLPPPPPPSEKDDCTMLQTRVDC